MLKGIKVPASRISCCARDVSLCERFFFSSPFQRMNPGIKGFYETFFGSWIRDAEGIEFAIVVPATQKPFERVLVATFMLRIFSFSAFISMA